MSPAAWKSVLPNSRSQVSGYIDVDTCIPAEDGGGERNKRQDPL